MTTIQFQKTQEISHEPNSTGSQLEECDRILDDDYGYLAMFRLPNEPGKCISVFTRETYCVLPTIKKLEW